MLAAILNVDHLVEVAGYPLLFLLVMAESSGVPIPGETALITAAVLASQGKLEIELVIALAAAAAIVGDNIGYVIGRKGGRWLLERPGRFHRQRLEVLRDRRAVLRTPRAEGGVLRALRARAARVGLVAGRRHAHALALVRRSGTRSAGSAGRPAIGLLAYFLGHSAGNAIQTFGLYGLARGRCSRSSACFFAPPPSATRGADARARRRAGRRRSEPTRPAREPRGAPRRATADGCRRGSAAGSSAAVAGRDALPHVRQQARARPRRSARRTARGRPPDACRALPAGARGRRR